MKKPNLPTIVIIILLVVFLLLAFLLILGILDPFEARADWFGVGEAISGVADAGARVTEAAMEAKWKIELIKAVRAIWPSLILLTSIIGTIASAVFAAKLVMRLHGTAQSILKDNKVTISEWTIFGVLATATLPIALGLMYFSFFLMRASQSGLSELMK